VWNDRQAKRMPTLFLPTIGAAITTGYLLTTGDVDLRPLDWHRAAAVTALTPAVVPILPAERAVCRTRLPVQVARCRGILRRAQRQ
jgi:hypothetical protein